MFCSCDVLTRILNGIKVEADGSELCDTYLYCVQPYFMKSFIYKFYIPFIELIKKRESPFENEWQTKFVVIQQACLTKS